MNEPDPAGDAILEDPPVLAALRFVLEVAAWVAIYFAWGWIPLVLSIAALSLFSVPGDKHIVLFPIPGPLRMAVEAAVGIAGVIAAHAVWGPRLAVPFLLAYLLFFLISYRRWIWMWEH